MDNSAKHIGKGIVAGFIATVVLTILMLIKSRTGMMPEFNVPQMLSGMVGEPGQASGWVVHFIIGTVVWGILFAWLAPGLSGDVWLRGVEFGIGAWLLMMIFIMPAANAGFFGMNLGVATPVMTFILHIIYGAVLGYSYGLFLAREPNPPGWTLAHH